MNHRALSPWQQLPAAPFFYECGRTPVLLEPNKILVSPCYDDHLHVFDCKSEKWEQYEWPHGNFESHVCCLSNDKTKLIAYEGFEQELVVVDLIAMKVINKFENLIETNQHPTMIADPHDDALVHIIGGHVVPVRHHTVNINTGELNEMSRLPTFARDDVPMEGCGIVYVQHKNMFILFGDRQLMFSYDLSSSQWSDIGDMTNPISKFGYIMTRDEKYLITFRGKYWDKTITKWISTDDILIFDIDTMEWIASEYKCPVPESENGVHPTVNAILAGNDEIHMITTEGYHWKMNLEEIIRPSDVLVTGYLKHCKIDIPHVIANEIVRFHGSIIV